MSLDADIERKTEKAFVQLLRPLVPTELRILPGGGSDKNGLPDMDETDDVDENADADDLIPPYAVIGVMDSDEFTTGSDTYTLNARLLLVTGLAKTTPQQHATWLSDLKEALDAIARPVTIDGLNFRLNGFDIIGRWEKVEDDQGQFRCHSLPLAIGANG